MWFPLAPLDELSKNNMIVTASNKLLFNINMLAGDPYGIHIRSITPRLLR